MLTGKNGILSKASTAKEKHLIAQYEEELNLCITEMQTDELGTLTMSKLIENLPQYIQTEQPGEQYEWKTDQTAEEPTGIYKGYEFYVDKNKKAHITEKATGIMISCSVEPSEYTNQNVKATIKIICNEGIQSIKQTEPIEEAIPASGKECIIVKENIETNTTFEYEVTDSNGNTETKTAQVTNIDTLPPKTAQINVENVTEGLKISVTAEDEDENEKNAKSGIGSYKYYIDGELKETSTKNTCIIKNLTLNQEYSVYVEVYDRAENKRQTEPTKITRKIPLKVKEISASEYSSSAIDEQGRIWVWGFKYDYLGIGTDGNVLSPQAIKTETKFKEINEGMYISIAKDEQNNLWAWGYNEYGQLGDGTTENRNTMKQITSGTEFKDIYAGFGQSYAIDAQGNIWAWGYNNCGQLGDGTNEDKTKPTKMTYDVKFKKIFVGSHHTLAIDEENNLWSWGYNNHGQLGDGTTTSSNKPKKIN